VETVHRAILVGNANYPADPHNLPTLNGPAHDLKLLAETLTDATHGLFRKEHVQTLFDNDRQEVEAALESFLLSASPDDHLLLYYSGHGVLDRADRLYFCARDSRIDRLVTTAISESQVKGMLDQSPARSFIILLDCCNSGTFTSKGVGGRSRWPPWSDRSSPCPPARSTSPT